MLALLLLLSLCAEEGDGVTAQQHSASRKTLNRRRQSILIKMELKELKYFQLRLNRVDIYLNTWRKFHSRSEFRGQ